MRRHFSSCFRFVYFRTRAQRVWQKMEKYLAAHKRFKLTHSQTIAQHACSHVVFRTEFSFLVVPISIRKCAFPSKAYKFSAAGNHWIWFPSAFRLCFRCCKIDERECVHHLRSANTSTCGSACLQNGWEIYRFSTFLNIFLSENSEYIQFGGSAAPSDHCEVNGAHCVQANACGIWMATARIIHVICKMAASSIHAFKWNNRFKLNDVAVDPIFNRTARTLLHIHMCTVTGDSRMENRTSKCIALAACYQQKTAILPDSHLLIAVIAFSGGRTDNTQQMETLDAIHIRETAAISNVLYGISLEPHFLHSVLSYYTLQFQRFTVTAHRSPAKHAERIWPKMWDFHPNE